MIHGRYNNRLKTKGTVDNNKEEILNSPICGRLL